MSRPTTATSLIALIGTWYVEAGKYGVMPVDGSGLAAHDRREAAGRRAARPATSTIPGTQSIPFFAGPRVLNRPHSITAAVEIPEGGAEGVLLAQGTAAGRLLVLHQGRRAALRAQLRRPGQLLHVASDTEPCAGGAHELRFEFEPTGEPDLAAGKGAPGRLQLYIDGALVGEGEAPVTIRSRSTPGRSPAARTPDRR